MQEDDKDGWMDREKLYIHIHDIHVALFCFSHGHHDEHHEHRAT
jgi:hypothetical protein